MREVTIGIPLANTTGELFKFLSMLESGEVISILERQHNSTTYLVKVSFLPSFNPQDIDSISALKLVDISQQPSDSSAFYIVSIQLNYSPTSSIGPKVPKYSMNTLLYR